MQDVVIIGSGIVGMTLANALARNGRKFVVIDAVSKPAFDPDRYDPRVSAIGRAAERIFLNLGAWPAISGKRISPFRNMVVWDAGSAGVISFDAANIGESHLGHIIENNLMVESLHRTLDEYRNGIVLWNTEVLEIIPGSDSVTIKTRNEVFTTRVLVGADGSSSWVRNQLGIETQGLDYEQRAIVAQVHTELPHEHTAWQRFLPTGPLAFLPLADGSCSIVWSCDLPFADELLQLNDSAFVQRLAESFEYRLGQITQIGPRKWFPLHRAHADSYITNRCALIGDAAHTIHPLAGQGVNLGIADAAALSQVILDATAVGKDIGSRSVLRRYERWRKGENALMLSAVHGLYRLFQIRSTPARQLRGIGLQVTNRSGPMKRAIVRRAMGLTGDLPDLAKPQTWVDT